MIGGFHYGSIRKVSADGTWTPIDSNGVKFGSTGIKWQDNVTTGIVPNSVWDLKNRPRTLFGGLAKVGTVWVSIYQASKRAEFSFMKGDNFLHVADGELQSRYGQMPVSGIDGLCQYNFAELAARSGMRMMKYSGMARCGIRRAAGRGSQQCLRLVRCGQQDKSAHRVQRERRDRPLRS